jgi:hypothetical protein
MPRIESIGCRTAAPPAREGPQPHVCSSFQTGGSYRASHSSGDARRSALRAAHRARGARRSRRCARARRGNRWIADRAGGAQRRSVAREEHDDSRLRADGDDRLLDDDVKNSWSVRAPAIVAVSVCRARVRSAGGPPRVAPRVLLYSSALSIAVPARLASSTTRRSEFSSTPRLGHAHGERAEQPPTGSQGNDDNGR